MAIDYRTAETTWDLETDWSGSQTSLEQAVADPEFDWASWSPTTGIPGGGSAEDLDVQPWEGTQTIDWSNPLSGAEYTGSLIDTNYQPWLQPEYENLSLMDMTAGQLGAMFAEFSVGPTQHGASWEEGSGEHMAKFEMAKHLEGLFNQAPWLGSGSEDMAREIEKSAGEEAELWGSYTTWEAGALPQYEHKMGLLESAYDTGVADITAAKRQQLRTIRESKAQLQRTGAAGLSQMASELGAAGLGGGSLLKLHKKQQSMIANQLQGLNLSAKQARALAKTSLEGAEAGLLSGQKAEKMRYAAEQSGEMWDVQSGIAGEQLSFEMASEAIYDEWMNNILNIVESQWMEGYTAEVGVEDVWWSDDASETFDPNEAMTDYFEDLGEETEG